MHSLLNIVLDIANDASEVIMKMYGRSYSVEFKKDSSPVTQADLAVHKFILKELRQLETLYPVLSEEGGVGWEGWKPGKRYWLVDPLDGTKEFISRNGEFTVNIALIEEGKPLLGVVVAPAMGVAYAAARGLGAFKVDSYGCFQRIHVARRDRESLGLRVLSSRHHQTAELTEWLKRLPSHQLTPMGSSVKFCLIAEGEADVYPRFGPTCLWDTAAAQVIVEEAGGVVEALEGEHIQYENPSQALNPSFVVWGGCQSGER